MSNWSEILTEVNQSFPTNIDLLNRVSSSMFQY